MDWDEHRAASERFIEVVEKEFPAKLKQPLSEAIYTFGELGLWFETEGISTEDGIRIWALVESVRKNGGFPKELRM